MAVIQMTSGVPGAGKTYSRVRFLIKDFLVNNTGLYITNLPLNVDMIVNDFSKKLKKDPEEIRERIIIIDPDKLKEFQRLKNCGVRDARDYQEQGTFPPAVYFESFNLTNAHIALDEFHLYFSKKTSRAVKDLWNDWIAEIRKNGCTFEAITQDVSQIPPEFMGKVSKRVDLVPLDITRDPFFKIEMKDWYQLRAGFTGQTSQKVCQIETHKGLLGRWVVSNRDKFTIVPEIYQYYHTSTRNDGRKAEGEIPPYKRLSKAGLILWFLRRNFFSVLSRFIMCCLFCWLVLLGGVNTVMMGFIDGMNHIARANIAKKRVGGNDIKKRPSVAQPGQKMISDSSEAVFALEKNFKPLSKEEFKKLPKIEQEIYIHALELHELKERLKKEKELEKKEYKPVMFFEGKAYLRNGLVVEKGYVFKKGVYNGKKVFRIDFKKRCYILLGGHAVTM